MRENQSKREGNQNAGGRACIMNRVVKETCEGRCERGEG